MYADRHAGRGRIDAGGLAAAVGMTTAIVAALAFTAPEWVAGPRKDPPITIIDVPLPRPEPIPDKPQPRDEVRPEPQPYRPDPIAPVPQPTDPNPIGTTDLFPPLPPGPLTGTPTGIGGGTGDGVAVDPPAPPPLLIGPAMDPRYADALQPPYPASEQRLGNDGRVTVRVRIGADGRVKEVQRVSATSDAFFRATEDQARRRWRFRPATRDGVPEDGWRTMTVTFVLAD